MTSFTALKSEATVARSGEGDGREELFRDLAARSPLGRRRGITRVAAMVTLMTQLAKRSALNAVGSGVGVLGTTYDSVTTAPPSPTDLTRAACPRLVGVAGAVKHAQNLLAEERG